MDPAELASLPGNDDLLGRFTMRVTAHETGTAPDSDLLSQLNSLLFPTATAGVPTVDDAAAFLNNVFAALPSTSTPETERVSLEDLPKTPAQVLQTAILDVLWSIDVLLESNGEVWPPKADAQQASPQRFKLRQLLAQLSEHIPLPLQKLRIALTIATDPSTEGRITQGEVRMRTSMYYKQQKFNLLREESEGYSKLVIELLGGMGPPHHAATALPVESEEARLRRAKRAMTNIQGLIGSFDLDPTRVLDLVLDVFSDNILLHHSFFRTLLSISPWAKRRKPATCPMPANGSTEMDVDTADPMQNGPEPDGGLDGQTGHPTIANVLGFKFVYYQSGDKGDVPQKLYLLASLLIWDGFVRLVDLYPHLSPTDEAVAALQGQFISDLAAKARAGTTNALAMAGTLDSSDLPSKPSRDSNKKVEEVPKTPPNQKVGLLTSLLAIGELQSALFILARFPWLGGPFPEVTHHLLRLMDRIIAPAFQPFQRGANSSTTSGFDLPKQRWSSTEHGMIDAAPLQDIITGSACAPDVPLKRQNYFFAEWESRLAPMQETPEKSLEAVLNLLKFVGCYLCHHLPLFNKLIILGTDAVSKNHRVEKWTEVIRLHFFPAFTVSEPTPSLALTIWNLLKHFEYSKRFSMYGEWKERAPKLYPQVKLSRSEAEKETKGLLKRIGSDAAHNKKFGRQFAKIAHMDPLTIFTIALSQVQSYENLIQPIIEAARYLTLFENDVLMFSMLEALSDPSRHRIKSDGMHQSLWLQGLSTFVATLFKKWPFEVGLVVEYTLKQLTSNNTADLVIVRDLVKHLGLTEATTPADISEQGLLSMSGGKALRSEFSSPTTIDKLRVQRKNATQKVMIRLRTALVDQRLGLPLLVRIAALRQRMTFFASEEEAAQLRILGNMFDQIHTTLLQMCEYISMQMAPSEQENILPPLRDLWETYEVEPGVAFLLNRIRLKLHQNYDVQQYNKTKAVQRDVKSEEPKETEAVVTEGDAQGEADVEMQEKPASEKDKPAEVEEPQPIWSPVLEESIAVAASLLQNSVSKYISPGFFVTFWNLELYDINLPTTLYTTLKNRVDALSSEAALLGDESERQRVQLRVREQSLTLAAEKDTQTTHIEATRARLLPESAHWIQNPARAQVIAQFTQRMIVPRAKMSPTDAVFCARFVQLMHDIGTPNFPSLSFYDKLFGDQLIPTLFHMTEDEVRNYARFLAEVLSTLTAWYKSEQLYNSQALGIDRTEGRTLVGFVQKAQALHNPATIKADDYLSHRSYRVAFAKWQKNTCTALRNCIESREYMMIRNGLLLLIPLADHFPFEAKIGQTLLAVVKTLGLRENEVGGREDLKVLTKGYEAILTKKSKTWELPPPPPPAPASTSAKAKEEPKKTEEEKPKAGDPAKQADSSPPAGPKADETASRPSTLSEKPEGELKMGEKAKEAPKTTPDTKLQPVPAPIAPKQETQVESTVLPSAARIVEDEKKPSPLPTGPRGLPTGLASLPARPVMIRSESRSNATNGHRTPSADRPPYPQRPISPEQVIPRAPLRLGPTPPGEPRDSRPPSAAPVRDTERWPSPAKPGNNGLPPKPPPPQVAAAEPPWPESSRPPRDKDDRKEADREQGKERDRDQRDREPKDRESHRDRERVEKDREREKEKEKRSDRDSERRSSRTSKHDGRSSRHDSPENTSRRRERDDRYDRDRDRDAHRSSKSHHSSRRERDDRHGSRSSRKESSHGHDESKDVKDSDSTSSKRRRLEEDDRTRSVPKASPARDAPAIPTGPKATSGIPTGPRAETEPAKAPRTDSVFSIKGRATERGPGGRESGFNRGFQDAISRASKEANVSGRERSRDYDQSTEGAMGPPDSSRKRPADVLVNRISDHSSGSSKRLRTSRDSSRSRM